ncbi:hypothetical protein MMC20_005505 [Loxospora ochrophaea]|nr:hypothetical protein [Loxospora ochrophaea]
MSDKKAKEEAKASVFSYAKAWGGKSALSSSKTSPTNIPSAESPLPPTLLATLITAQHARPFQFLPLLFPPVFLFSTYLNIYDFKIDAAGLNAAWSGLYLVLAARRKQPLMRRFGTRGIVRGATMGLCVANLLGGGFTYAVGQRGKEEKRRDGEGGV